MYYLFIMRQVICLFVYIGKNPRFTAFLDSNLHTRLAIVTENELGLAFLPKNLRKKISSRSVHVLFSYRGDKQTNRQTDRQTNADKKIIPRFHGDNEPTVYAYTRAKPLLCCCQWIWHFIHFCFCQSY